MFFGVDDGEVMLVADEISKFIGFSVLFAVCEICYFVWSFC